MKYVRTERGIGIQFEGVDSVFYPKHGYGSIPEKNGESLQAGILSYAQDYTTKKRLLDITDNPRITNRGEDTLLSFLLSKICDRRFTLMEARRIKGISLRKKSPSTPDTKGEDQVERHNDTDRVDFQEAELVASPPLKTTPAGKQARIDKAVKDWRKT